MDSCYIFSSGQTQSRRVGCNRYRCIHRFLSIPSERRFKGKSLASPSQAPQNVCFMAVEKPDLASPCSWLSATHCIGRNRLHLHLREASRDNLKTLQDFETDLMSGFAFFVRDESHGLDIYLWHFHGVICVAGHGVPHQGPSSGGRSWTQSWDRSWGQSTLVIALIKCLKGLMCQELLNRLKF